MSKARANEIFAGEVQRHLQSTGHYHGALDDWAGPLTREAWRQFSLGEGPEIPPPTPGAAEPEEGPTVGGSDLPSPAASYRLPRETSAAMTAMYGAASASPTYLDWFSFPTASVLYSRSGSLLKDHVGDERPDHRCHRLLAGRLTNALAEIYRTLGDAEFRRQGWHVYGGCHNYRAKTGGRSLSTHAWGVAVDFNPAENPYHATRTTFSDGAVDIMERWGFLSGGRAWGKDWMHFQAVVPSISSGSFYARHGLPKNIITA